MVADYGLDPLGVGGEGDEAGAEEHHQGGEDGDGFHQGGFGGEDGHGSDDGGEGQPEKYWDEQEYERREDALVEAEAEQVADEDDGEGPCEDAASLGEDAGGEAGCAVYRQYPEPGEQTCVPLAAEQDTTGDRAGQRTDEGDHRYRTEECALPGELTDLAADDGLQHDQQQARDDQGFQQGDRIARPAQQ
ncbi:hypothetical protein NONI108955_36850 [Nocardia ninae]